MMNFFYSLSNIVSADFPVEFSNIPIKLDKRNTLSYTEVINIKLNNSWIVGESFLYWDNSKKAWKWDVIKDIFDEEQIEFNVR